MKKAILKMMRWIVRSAVVSGGRQDIVIAVSIVVDAVARASCICIFTKKI